MPSLSVEPNDLVHSLKLGLFPFFRRHTGRFGENEHTGFDLKFMGVPRVVGMASVLEDWYVSPKLLFLWIQSLVDMLGDHVFDPNQSCVFLIGVVYETLTEIFTNMRAVVIRFNKTCYSLASLVCVDV